MYLGEFRVLDPSNTRWRCTCFWWTLYKFAWFHTRLLADHIRPFIDQGDTSLAADYVWFKSAVVLKLNFFQLKITWSGCFQLNGLLLLFLLRDKFSLSSRPAASGSLPFQFGFRIFRFLHLLLFKFVQNFVQILFLVLEILKERRSFTLTTWTLSIIALYALRILAGIPAMSNSTWPSKGMIWSKHL